MGKQIIRDRAIVDDDWTWVADDAALPSSGKIIVSWTRWQADKAALKARGNVGVSVPPTLDVAELKDDVGHLSLVAVALNFIQPKPEGGRTFDGRAYSQARLLRERFGFKGEIRAHGDVFRDSMYYASRCGVNAFELKPERSLEDALRGFRDFSQHYQGAADDPTPIFRRRQG